MATFIEEMQTATGNSHPGGRFFKALPPIAKKERKKTKKELHFHLIIKQTHERSSECFKLPLFS